MQSVLLFLSGAAVVGALVLARIYLLSFRAQASEDYDGLGPDFDVRHHLNGPMHCEGVIYGPMGRVSSRFTAKMRGEWTGNTGVLREHFVYDSGETQDRAWHLELSDSGAIRATADDIVGAGTGQQSGPTVRLNYRIRLPADAGGHTLSTTDWMYLIDDGAIINRSQFRKYGIKVAELVATMRPEEKA